MQEIRKREKDESPPSWEKKHATREDVCRAVGVSTATVSRALNNEPGVGPELRQKVLAAAKKLNYVPQAAARNLSRAKSDTLGVVFQDLTSGWLLTIFRGIINRASGDYQVLNSLSTREGDEFDLPNKMLAARQVDGLIWLDMRVTPTMIGRIKKLAVPFVLLQHRVDDPAVNTVCIENRHGAYDAVHHLLELGHRDLLIIAGARDNADSERKLVGVRHALRDYDVTIPLEDILQGHHVGTHAVSALSKRLAERSSPPEAIFCFNDEMAIAVLFWLREHGLRVPEDVALVGYDGILEAKYVGLTTVETPMYDMGVLGAQRLIELIEDPSGEQKARHIVLTGQLTVRDTCGAHLKQS